MATKLNDLINKVKEKAKNSGYKDNAIKPPKGKSVWRILPGWDKENPLNFFHAFGQHYIKGTDGKVRTVIGCVDKTYDKHCEICEMISEAVKAAESDEDRKVIQDMRAQLVYLVNAVEVKEGNKLADKPVVMAMPKTLFEQSFMDALGEYEEGMLDLAEGNDVVITREGTGFDTKYSLIVRSRDKSSTIPESLWQMAENLEDFVKDDFETKRQKAIDAIGEHMGKLPSSIEGYGGPGAKSLEDKSQDDDLDDVIDGTASEVDETEPPSKEEKKKAEKSFDDEIDDDDLDAMLDDL
jgi:hypothetical protein